MGFLSDRRVAPRYPRRIEVRFWRLGEAQPHSGFTTNISKSGVFLGTGHLLAPGERVRLEIVDPEKGFVTEGRVVRVHRVALALRHVDQAGVGIRFLLPEELVAELVPAARAGPAPPRAATAVSLKEAEPDGATAGEDPEPPESAGAPAPGGANGAAARTRIQVDFSDRATFLSVYHRDLASGGLFVSTPTPAALREIVLIELRTPVATPQPLLFEARVVHRFEPDAAIGSGRNLLSGMGVQFLDPERVKAALAPILAELRK